MSSNLEEFIKDNRNEFDNEFPSEKVWDGIVGQAVKNKKSFSVIAILKWGIAAAVFIGVVFTFLLKENKSSSKTETVLTVKNDSVKDIGQIVPEYEPAVNSIAKMIVMKQEELKALASIEPKLYNRFSADLNQLDSSYKSLKNELNTSLNREMLIEAMIQNLQLQLHVLNQQLKIIKQIKQSKNENVPGNPSA